MKFLLSSKHYCIVGIVLAAAGLLSGCGQYGNLYLPKTQPPSQQTADPADKPQSKDPQQTED